ncbi:MAG: signal peptidase I [Candidatus Xenolissoclinum pacificiensis L6]|uniref:Signal peptidase I n=1 Tax=Candidatus Xenolissoclinum pacificiensis L6 TaxID=1401685 RepID=W2UZ15_9RICK|nr:MAG: signal peptidase I [Candidatus Xenolissoclinum pacificiensis L6]
MTVKSKNSFLSMVKSFTIALILAILFRSLFFEPYRIPSGSMNNTLIQGDYVFVSKYSYGYTKYSFPFSPNIFGGKRIFGSVPNRGDVVVFRPTQTPSINYVKRVIAIGGDTIQIRDSIVYVNGQPLKRELVNIIYNVNSPDYEVYREFISEDKYYEILLNKKTNLVNLLDLYRLDNTQAITIPEGYIFVMGDNRHNSFDSRKIGIIPIENVVGQVKLVALSVKKGDIIPITLRYDRILKGVY